MIELNPNILVRDVERMIMREEHEKEQQQALLSKIDPFLPSRTNILY